MIAKIFSFSIEGINAFPVEVEVDVKSGLPTFIVVGLPDTAVKESRDRVRSAITNSNYKFPSEKITVNLAPADVKKEGSMYDLPVAIGILASNNQITINKQGYAIIGELALDGRVRPVKGIISIAIYARKNNLAGIIIPSDNAKEAGVIDGIEIIPVKDLNQAIGFISGQLNIQPYTSDFSYSEILEDIESDMSEIKGQEHAKRALTVAAAGGHNVLMVGPPGTGKTMLARRVPSILPPLTIDEAIETTQIHSIAGLLSKGTGLLTQRPFRSPHHTISEAGMVGGGSNPRPGEVSLAHNGVLFLDELPEFNKRTLEVLRQPVEDGVITVTRVSSVVTYPARFMLIAAMNPCPCGYFSHPEKTCRCTSYQIQRYINKISGPLLDRIDIHIEVPPISYSDMETKKNGMSSKEMRDLVIKAREIQIKRYKGCKIYCNADLDGKLLKHICKLDRESQDLLQMAMREMTLSARSYTRILKVARTIADLDGSEEIKANHISEAIQYRYLDKGLWG